MTDADSPKSHGYLQGAVWLVDFVLSRYRHCMKMATMAEENKVSTLN
jgi:hypothetical protein